MRGCARKGEGPAVHPPQGNSVCLKPQPLGRGLGSGLGRALQPVNSEVALSSPQWPSEAAVSLV